MYNFGSQSSLLGAEIGLLEVIGAMKMSQQDKIFRRKRLSTGAKFVHVYLKIWDKGILKFNIKFSM